MKSYKPTLDRCLIKIYLPKKVGEIHLPEESRKQQQRGSLKGKILKAGPKAEHVKEGDTVLFHKHLATSYDSHTIKEGDDLHVIIKESDLLCIMEVEDV